MKIISTATLLFILIICSKVFAQEDLIFMTNSKSIDENRYEGIKSSPYYFDDWVVGSLIDKTGNTIEGITMNYNGYSDNIEVKKGNQFIELETKDYQRIEVLAADNPKLMKPDDGEKIVFKGGVHTRFRNRIVQIIYEGKNVTFINDFDIVLSSKEVNNVGKAIEFKQFVKRNTYYLLKDDQLKVVKPNRRKILEALGNDPAVNKYIKSERLNLNSRADLAKLIAFYDGLEE